jgi:hypothetical protein
LPDLSIAKKLIIESYDPLDLAPCRAGYRLVSVARPEHVDSVSGI